MAKKKKNDDNITSITRLEMPCGKSSSVSFGFSYTFINVSSLLVQMNSTQKTHPADINEEFLNTAGDPGKLNLGKGLKLLIGLLISCTLFD